MNDSATSRFSVLGNHAASFANQIKPKAAFFSLGVTWHCRSCVVHEFCIKSTFFHENKGGDMVDVR